MKECLRFLVKELLIFAAAFICGTSLLVAVYSIPNKQVRETSLPSSIELMQEGAYPPAPIFGRSFLGCTLDNYTDAVMLGIASVQGTGNAWYDAMACKQIPIGNLDPVKVFYQYCRGQKKFELTEYNRYWHGYLIFLKPLLTFMDYAYIRILNGILQILLLGFIIFLFIKKGKSRLILPYIAMLFSLRFLCMPFSLQFSSIYYLVLLSTVYLLWNADKLFVDAKCYLLFWSLGIFTAFFDLLTYPVVTLGIPFTLCLLLHGKEMKQPLLKLIKSSVLWGLGYGVMWFSKWVLAGIVMRQNAIADALHEVGVRSGSSLGNITKITYSQVLIRNFSMMQIGWFILALCIVWFIGLGTLHAGKEKKRKSVQSKKEKDISVIKGDKMVTRILFLLIALMPFCWYSLTKNHSYIHCFFTFRELSITIFALFALPFDESYT